MSCQMGTEVVLGKLECVEGDGEKYSGLGEVGVMLIYPHTDPFLSL